MRKEHNLSGKIFVLLQYPKTKEGKYEKCCQR